jgi:EmrB/QacA subfamily drug resistance transporter
VLTALTACQLMVVLDSSIVNIALPDIRSGLHFSAAGLSWVLNAYTLTFGGLLLLGGRAGDILGRRRVFLVGITLFTVASLVAGLAPDAATLVAARAVQGVGGAIASPTALALISTSFEGPARARAIGVYGAVSGAGGTVGLILGGVLTEWTSWRWVMFVNVPIGVLVALLAVRHISEPARARGRFDLAGALLSTLGVTALTYALIRGASNGWSDTWTIGSLAAAVVLLAVFLAVETRVPEPLMPLGLFAHRNRAGANLILLFVSATMFGMFFFLTQFLQNILGLTPLQAGFAFLPWGVMIFVTSQLVKPLAEKFGMKPVMVSGAVAVTAAMIWLTRIDTHSSYAAAVLGPMFLFGVGVGLLFTLVTRVGLTDVEPRQAGAASGVLNVSQRVGGTIGLAVLVAVYGGVAGNGHHRSDVTHGYTTAFTVAVAYTVAALLLALLVLRTPPRAKAAAPAQAAPTPAVAPTGGADAGEQAPTAANADR